MLGRVPISGQRVSLGRVATPPGPSMAGRDSHARPSDQIPDVRGLFQGNGLKGSTGQRLTALAGLIIRSVVFSSDPAHAPEDTDDFGA